MCQTNKRNNIFKFTSPVASIHEKEGGSKSRERGYFAVFFFNGNTKRYFPMKIHFFFNPGRRRQESVGVHKPPLLTPLRFISKFIESALLRRRLRLSLRSVTYLFWEVRPWAVVLHHRHKPRHASFDMNLFLFQLVYPTALVYSKVQRQCPVKDRGPILQIIADQCYVEKAVPSLPVKSQECLGVGEHTWG